MLAYAQHCSAVLVVAAIVWCSRDVRAQGVAGVDANRQAEPSIMPEPLAERIEREVWFLAKVGELSDEQSPTLRKELTALAERRPGAFRVGNHQQMVERQVLVDGRLHHVLVPADEISDEALRGKELSLLAGISPEAAARVQAERQRLETFRKQATALAELAVFDECLLLTSDQRAKFCQALALPENDAWWRPTSTAAVLDTALRRRLDQLSGRHLGAFVISDAALEKLLLPSQLAIFHQLRRPVAKQLIVEGRIAVNGRQGSAAVVERRLVHRGPRSQDDVEWLSLCLAQRVSVLFATCGRRRWYAA